MGGTSIFCRCRLRGRGFEYGPCGPSSFLGGGVVRGGERVPGRGVVVLARCWVLRDRAVLPGGSWGGLVGCLGGWGRGSHRTGSCLVSSGAGCGCWVVGCLRESWLLVENCTVDASIFVAC